MLLGWGKYVIYIAIAKQKKMRKLIKEINIIYTIMSKTKENEKTNKIDKRYMYSHGKNKRKWEQ